MGLLFGTDGVRGLANEDLSIWQAGRIAMAAAHVLGRHLGRKPRFLLARDTRLSGQMLEHAVCAGLTSTGATAVCIGVAPTPAVAYLVQKYSADAGIMISASHNPSEYNGIKIFGAQGFKIPDEYEEEIERIVLDHAAKIALPDGNHVGHIEETEGALEDYIAMLTSAVPQDLSGIRVLVDCANGSASVTARPLFERLHADCVILNEKPDGVNINHRCGSMHVEDTARLLSRYNCDVAFAFDGDADRFLAVDETGEVVDGDEIIAIFTKDYLDRGGLKNNTIVATVMSNMGLFRFAEEFGVNCIKTKVGDRFVLEEMINHDDLLGGEQSGHIILREFASTGDGQLTAVKLLSIMKRNGAKLCDLKKVMRKFPQMIVNVDASKSQKLLFSNDAPIADAIAEQNARLKNSGRLLVRPSGTEPYIRVMCECMDHTLMQDCVDTVVDTLKRRLYRLDD